MTPRAARSQTADRGGGQAVKSTEPQKLPAHLGLGAQDHSLEKCRRRRIAYDICVASTRADRSRSPRHEAEDTEDVAEEEEFRMSPRRRGGGGTKCARRFLRRRGHPIALSGSASLPQLRGLVLAA